MQVSRILVFTVAINIENIHGNEQNRHLDSKRGPRKSTQDGSKHTVMFSQFAEGLGGVSEGKYWGGGYIHGSVHHYNCSKINTNKMTLMDYPLFHG